MKTVHIMCGISGSGKTTYAKSNFPEAQVVSADHYFTKPEGYLFDPSKLPNTHAECLRRYVQLVSSGTPDIVVDNTNTRSLEIAPYSALALAYGYTLDIIVLKCNPVLAHMRNVHDVPFLAIQAQAARIKRLLRDCPPWWPLRVVYR
jgi:predicted kinase